MRVVPPESFGNKKVLFSKIAITWFMHWAADLVRAKDPYFMNLDVIHRTVTFEIDHSHPRYLRTVIYRMETCKLNVNHMLVRQYRDLDSCTST